MIRECQEEIVVTPTSYRAVAELDFIQDSDTGPWQMYGYAYICDRWEGNPVETEEMAPRWFNRDDIPYDMMWDDGRYWLDRALAGEKLMGKFWFNAHDRLVKHAIKSVDKLAHQ